MSVIDPLRRPTFLRLDGFAEETASTYLPRGTAASHIQLGSGRLGGEVGVIPFDRGPLRFGNYSVSMRISGNYDPRYFHLAFALELPVPGALFGTPMHEGMLLACQKDGAGDIHVGAGIRWIGLNLEWDVFSHMWQGLGERDLGPPGLAFLATPSPETRQGLTDVLLEVEAYGRQKPALFDNPLWRINVENAVIDRYLTALLSAVDRGGTRSPDRAGLVVRKIDDVLLHAIGVPPTVAELCRLVGTGRRTLERICRDAMGIGPAEYLRVWALNQARHALLDPASAFKTVTQTAVEFGFWHLGRFAAYYHAHFGEYPRDTRQRTAARMQAPATHNDDMTASYAD